VYVGIKGGFGDVRFGEVPVAAEYGQVAGDLFDQTGDINGGISYTGAFGPATIGANFSPGRNEDSIGVGAKFNIGAFAVGVGVEDRDELMNASVGASFALAGASVALHYVSKENADTEAVAADPNATPPVVAVAAMAADDSTVIGAKLGYSIAGVSLGLTYQVQDTGDLSENALRLDLGYGLGGGMKASARFNTSDNDAPGDNSASDWRLMLSKSF